MHVQRSALTVLCPDSQHHEGLWVVSGYQRNSLFQYSAHFCWLQTTAQTELATGQQECKELLSCNVLYLYIINSDLFRESWTWEKRETLNRISYSVVNAVYAEKLMLMKLIFDFFIILAPRELSGCSVSLRELLFNACESADWTAAIPPQTQQPFEEPRYASILYIYVTFCSLCFLLSVLDCGINFEVVLCLLDSFILHLLSQIYFIL